ncbi:MAG: T9SS type A sorting domain-containing protein, partial [candidate division WOR-3 bacterium]
LFKIHSISDTTFLFIFSKNDSLWHKIEGIDGNDFSLWRAEESGIFSFGYIKDKRGPLIKCLLNGEEIEENAKIKKGMSLDFVFSDSSGIDLFYEKPEILLDGIDIFDSLNFNKGIQNPKMVSSSYKLKNLKEGIHALEIKIYDCLGNLSSKTISFFIFEPFDIILKGIYPNPARKDKVVIVFENTKELESIKIKILTVSGREIYEFDPYQDPIRPPLTRKGIHWVEWFLNDKFGNKVSNGVYILYIEGKWGNKIKRIIEKIAVLR